MDPIPVCVVCRTAFRYRGPQPHLLPCLHAVCQDCLKSPEVTALDCSVCSKSYDICDTDRQFPVDEVVLAEVLHLTSKHRPAEFLCTNDEDGNQAVCWCRECGDFLCEHCQVSHSKIKATKNHTVQWMSDISQTTKRSQPLCEKHNQRMDIYDNDCDCFICPRCFYYDHSSHTTKKADELLKKEEDNLNENLKSLSTKQEEIVRSSDKVNEQTESIGRKATSLRETVQHTFAQLKALIDQREKEVLVELDQLLDSMRNINDSRRPSLKSTETSCLTVIDYINKTLLYASPSDLHKLKSSIAQAFESCVGVDIPTVHKYESSVAFSKQEMQHLKSLVSSFGSFMVPDGNGEEVPEFTPEITTLKSMVSNGKVLVKELGADVSRLKQFVIQLDPDGPTMMFDSDRVNRNRTHINDEGLLINSTHPREKAVRASGKMLKTYCGTSSTSPLPSSGLVYWEVEADVELGMPLGDRELVLEIGVCEEEVMDNSFYVGNQLNSSSLFLMEHLGVIQTVFSSNTHPDTRIDRGIDNKEGTMFKFRYGILVNVDERKVTYIGNEYQRRLGYGSLGNVKKGSTIWPLFGVYCSAMRVALKLVCGQEVQMDDWKKDLLVK
ncbi:E3 ubiquitin-protein ligase TRIM33-like [Haliotis cracherodii]|uniref:E3 ubiquitin-protein ligase TRIM33-like n=1 Tax=Haliotis cracherodii TaxID=6455 RepID=UPI0039E95A16